MERYEEYGLTVRRICAGGGIAQKDPMLMQIYADVTGKEIRVTGTKQAGALGSAMYAAVAGGIYPDIRTASDAMSPPDCAHYGPIPENAAAYEPLYAQYRRLHDLFGGVQSGSSV